MLKVGHRGARGEAPENTLEGFALAIKEGANAIEFDVRETQDRRLIVIHDEKLDRTTKMKGLVKSFTLGEIKKACRDVPTLEEALDFLKNKKLEKILVEIKEPGTEERVLREIKKRKMENRVMVISFYEKAIWRAKKLSKVETGFIFVGNAKKNMEIAKKVGAGYVLPLHKFTHSGDVKRAHERGLKVIVWTVNKRGEAEEYKKKGVDGIASDFPKILVGL
ncbi:MAG: glycerophosphodiester phosphodiesterase [Candidatus Anstonellales archaeon]